MTKGTYEIKNRLDGMAYGGSSGDIEQRWMAHLWMLRNDRHHCAHLQNAWNKYGEDVFEFSVLEVIEDPDERLAAEQAWLDIHHANKTCYNVAITAGPAGPMAEETKQKLSAAHKGKKHTDEHRRNNSNAKMGHATSPETRKKLSKAGMGRVVSEETRQKLRDREYTEEALCNMSDAQREYSAARRKWLVGCDTRWYFDEFDEDDLEYRRSLGR